MQQTWTRLPQGFKTSPTLSGEALAAELTSFPRDATRCTLLQDVGDLLLARDTQESFTKGTKVPLQLLSDPGHRVSKRKAQICQQQVRYLGFLLTQGSRELGPERKKVVISLPQPQTDRGTTRIPGGCRIRPQLDPGVLGNGQTPL